MMHLIIHMFNTSMIPYIQKKCTIISVFKPQFIHYTKCAKYAFLLLFSIIVQQSRVAKYYNHSIVCLLSMKSRISSIMVQQPSVVRCLRFIILLSLLKVSLFKHNSDTILSWYTTAFTPYNHFY